MSMRLAKASALSLEYSNPFGDLPENYRLVPGFAPSYRSSRSAAMRTQNDYIQELRQCRYFYRIDPIASTVINRICELAVGSLRNRRGYCSDEEIAYFNAIAPRFLKLLKAAAREFLVNGMALPEYVAGRIQASRLSPAMTSRTRLYYPEKMWLRNPEFIILKRQPTSMERSVFVQITDDERYFLENQGKYRDGTYDRETYNNFVRQYPEYVDMIVNRQLSSIPLPNAHPILRNPMSHDDYPYPYLVPALAPMKHKMRIKQMDYSMATRALEAIRLIKAGDKDFPLDEDDDTLDDLEAQIRKNREVNENIFTLFANHTVTMEWIYPPFDALLSDAKYSEPNSDIFLALGFSRMLLVGEALRSNAGQGITGTMGPTATIEDLRNALLEWVAFVYDDLAQKNKFKASAIPVFSPLRSTDLTALVQFAIEAAKMGSLSKDTVAKMFGSDYEDERQQIENEKEVSGQPEMFDVVYNKPEPAPSTGA